MCKSIPLLALVWLLASCVPVPPPADGDIRPSPTTAQPMPAPRGWIEIQPGVEVLETQDGLLGLRHQPSRVLYQSSFQPDPSQSLLISNWLASDTDAFAAINCGFFRQDADGAYHHMGLLMTNGNSQAKLRSGWGGVLIVRDGAAFIAPRPQKLLAPATLGLQGWPMLVQNQQIVPRLDAVQPARRTAVGIDKRGNIVWLATQQNVTLVEFARLLHANLPELSHAVNLDGGSSTGLRWRTSSSSPQSGIDSFPIPCAIRLQTP